MALDDLYNDVLSMAIRVVRTQTALPALVNHETVGDRTQGMRRGGITEVVIPPEFSTRDVVPAANFPASGDAPNPSTMQVPLNYWKEVPIPLTNQQITQMENARNVVPMFLENAVSPIIEDMTASIAALYKNVYGIAGTIESSAYVDPFGTSVAEVQQAKKILTQQKTPKFMRRIAANTDAYGNAIGLEAFRSFLHSGSDETLREGEITRAYGFDWHEDAGLDGIVHTTGAAGTVLVDQADIEVGDTVVHFDGFTTKASVGDIFTVAGDTQTYVVVACTDLTGTDADVTISPAVKVAWADNAAVSFKPSHSVSLAFNPYAIAFDSRPEAGLVIEGLPRHFRTWVDEMTGIVLRLEIRQEYHQTSFYLSCLWGCVMPFSRFACRLAGAVG